MLGVWVMSRWQTNRSGTKKAPFGETWMWGSPLPLRAARSGKTAITATLEGLT